MSCDIFINAVRRGIIKQEVDKQLLSFTATQVMLHVIYLFLFF